MLFPRPAAPRLPDALESRAATPARTGYCGAKTDAIEGSVAKVAKNAEADAAVKILVEHLDLTPRQAEVLHWVAEGKTNQEISIITSCSFFTVKNHVKSIFERLGVHSRVAAAACCYRVLLAVQSGAKPPKRPKAGASARVRRPARQAS